MKTTAFAFRLLTIASMTLALCAGPLGASPAGALPVVFRVTVGGATSGACGDVWASPCDLQYALTSLAGAGTELWLAAGTYVAGALESDSFIVPEGVRMYGGFDGIDDEWADRDPVTKISTLSGDLGGGSNSTHVVQIIGPATAATVLDGFTITGGNANDLPPGDRGGGLYCDGAGSGNTCNPTLTNLAFKWNYASLYGGAIYLDGSMFGTASPVMSSVTFLNNAADFGSGGAMYNEGTYGTSSPSLTGGTFQGNLARVGSGGAIYNHAENGIASPTLTQVTFTSNWAATSGGAIYSEAINGGISSPSITDATFTDNSAVVSGGSLYSYADGASAQSSPALLRVTFTASQAGAGAALYYKGATTGESSGTMTQVDFSGNMATTNGGAIYLEGLGGKSEPRLRNMDFTSNSAENGGALYMISHGGSGGNTDVEIIGAEFINNEASAAGGAVYQESSGEDNQGAGSTLSIINAVFSSNLSSGDGGALYIHTELEGSGGTNPPAWEDPKGFLHVANVSMSNNVALGYGGAIAASADTGSIASVNVQNSILWGDSGVSGPDEVALAGNGNAYVSYSDISGGCPAGADCSGGGILNADPVYVDATSHDLRVQANSPTIDAGDNNYVPSEITTDIAGDPRLVDHPGVPDTGNGYAPIVDMGAYEYQFSCPAGAILYVDIDATGEADGSSWADAYTSIPVALGTYEYCASVEEMWVAEGVYLAGTHRNDTNSIVAGTKMYGGFAGTETLREQRDPAAHPTVLTGDINGDDTATNGVVMDAAGIQGDNLYHVVYMYGDPPITSTNTVLDGFTITGGQANGASYPDDSGGGLYCFGRSDALCSPTLENLVFSGNFAEEHGGALMNAGSRGASSPLVRNATFRGNAAGDPDDGIYSGDGGAVYNEGYGEDLGSGLEPGLSSPTFINVTFTRNRAEISGGAMYNDGTWGGVSSPIVANATFHQNEAGAWGGAILNEAAYGGTSLTSITNATFAFNSASSGGQIVTDGYDGGTANVTVINSILWGGAAPVAPEAMTQYGTTTFSYSLIANAYDEFGQWDTVLGTDGGNNYEQDPMLQPLGDHGGPTQTMPVKTVGAAIDEGSDAACDALPVNGSDQRGVIRPQGTQCDIGAFEAPVVDNIGIHSENAFFLRDAHAGGSADLAFTYGWAGATPLMGDWDGDGEHTVGIHADGWFFLRNENSAGPADLVFQYGWAGATPLVGDWDGDGVETIGIFSDGWFYLRNSNTPGPADLTFPFGWAGVTPLVGDWDGDHLDTIGVHSGDAFFLRNSNTAGGADLMFNYGWEGAKPITGDWNGDGMTTVGLDCTCNFFLRNLNNAGPADLTYGFGWSGAESIVGAWDMVP